MSCLARSLGALLLAGAIAAGAIPSQAGAETAAAAGDECRQSYTVKRGDMLGDIAERFYGDVREYLRLHRENVGVIGPDPWVLEVGMVLSVPCEEGGRAHRAAEAAAEAARDAARDPREGWEPVIGTDRLAALRRADRRLQILDIRAPSSLSGGVIPGALSVPYARWSEATDGPADASGAIAAAGLRLDRPIVVVTEGEGAGPLGQGAWVYWLLRSAGAGEVAILEGGHTAWAARNLPLWAGPATPEPRAAVLAPSDRWRATRDDVAAIIEGRAAGGLMLATAGHAAEIGDPPATASLLDVGRGATDPLPGWAQLGREEAALAALDWFKAVDLPWERAPVAIHGETPERAALAWFYASEIAGIRNVRLAPALPKLDGTGDRSWAWRSSVACAQKNVKRNRPVCTELERLPDIR